MESDVAQLQVYSSNNASVLVRASCDNLVGNSNINTREEF